MSELQIQRAAPKSTIISHEDFVEALKAGKGISSFSNGTSMKEGETGMVMLSGEGFSKLEGQSASLTPYELLLADGTIVLNSPARNGKVLEGEQLSFSQDDFVKLEILDIDLEDTDTWNVQFPVECVQTKNGSLIARIDKSAFLAMTKGVEEEEEVVAKKGKKAKTGK